MAPPLPHMACPLPHMAPTCQIWQALQRGASLLGQYGLALRRAQVDEVRHAYPKYATHTP
eukprot:5737777-Prymnesium_polylepis.1